ncbi:MAG: hypothetical protein ACFB9N_15465 [Geitlerinemataceae cyanobacterium]
MPDQARSKKALIARTARVPRLRIGCKFYFFDRARRNILAALVGAAYFQLLHCAPTLDAVGRKENFAISPRFVVSLHRFVEPIEAIAGRNIGMQPSSNDFFRECAVDGGLILALVA